MPSCLTAVGTLYEARPAVRSRDVVLRIPGFRQIALTVTIGWMVQGAIAQEAAPVAAPAAQAPLANEAAASAAETPAASTKVDSKAQPSAAAGPALAERGPSVFLVPDAAGVLQPVLNLSLDRLERLLAQDQANSEGKRPDYALSLLAEGEARANDAELDVTVDIRALKGGWIAVPLRLDEGLLLPESDRYEGPGSAVLLPAVGARGYVCWLRGDADAQHQLKLTLRVPIVQRSGETQLRLMLPRASAAQLKLHVAGDRVQGRATEPAALDVEPVVEGGGTDFRLSTAAERFELSWSHADDGSVEDRQALEATGAISVHIDGRTIRTQARLSIQSLVGEFSRCHVRLPVGAQLVAASGGPGYTVQELRANDPDAPVWEANSAPGSVVAVRFSQPAEQAEIFLETERQLDEQAALADVELAGFMVRQARRQAGNLALAVEGDWQIVWQRQHQVRRITPAELPEALGAESLVAAFEYWAQPCSLVCRIVPRTPRVTASAASTLIVEPDGVRLQARLKYSVRGARLFALECRGLDPAWKIEEIGPATLVDVDSLSPDERDPLVVPLLKPALGEVELTIVARRTRLADGSPWREVLVEPVATVLRPGSLVVTSANNVQIIPLPEELVGLTPQPLASNDSLPALAGEEPLSYRATGPLPRFVARCRQLPRETTAQVATVVECRRSEASVTQTTVVQITREASDRIDFDVPAALSSIAGKEVLIDGNPASVVVSDLSAELDGARELAPDPLGLVRDPSQVATGGRVWTLTLPQPRLGRVEVVIRYPLAVAAPPPGKDGMLDVQLPMPRVDRVTQNAVRLLAEAGLELRAVSADWQVDKSEAASRIERGSGQRLLAEGAQFQLPLRITATGNGTADALVVERAWIQTWHLGTDRQDRAVFELLTGQSRVEFLLPAGADAKSLQVLLDGARVAPTQGTVNRTVNRVVVPLAVSRDRRHVIELQYRCPNTLSTWGRLELTPPSIVPECWVRQAYWQFVLGDQEHLAYLPANWGPEFHWRWAGPGWERRSRLDDDALERWSGAHHERDAPQGYHRYLASRVGDLQPVAIVTAPRWLIVLSMSGASLVVGLLLLYVPRLRRPEWLLALGAVATAACLWDVQLAVLAAQAGSLGVLLSLLAAWWHRQARGQRPVRVIVTRSGSSRLDHDLTPTAFAVAGTGSNSSTTAASVPVE